MPSGMDYLLNNCVGLVFFILLPELISTASNVDNSTRSYVTFSISQWNGNAKSNSGPSTAAFEIFGGEPMSKLYQLMSPQIRDIKTYELDPMLGNNDTGFQKTTNYSMANYEEISNKEDTSSETSGTRNEKNQYTEKVSIKRYSGNKAVSEHWTKSAILSQELFYNLSETKGPSKLKNSINESNKTSPLELSEDKMPPKYCRMGSSIRGHLPVQNGYFSNQTCYYCYEFIPSHRKKRLLDVRNGVFVDSFTNISHAYNYYSENETYYHFSPSDERSWSIISESMSNEIEANKLKFCCTQAETCCKQIIENGLLVNPKSYKYCPPTWDGWSCFSNVVEASKSAVTLCPIYAYEGYPACYKYAEKRCLDDGTWETRNGHEWTDYTSCSLRSYEIFLLSWELATHTLSILFLTPAIFILLCVRNLRSQRHYTHLNFYLALLGKSLFKILEIAVLKIPEITNESVVLEENSAGCKFLVFLAKYFLVATWSWMLAESYYLHHLIARAFKQPSNICIFLIVGWVTPGAVVGAWAITRSVLEDSHCWLGASKSNALRLHLITEIFQVITLSANILLLIDMARVLGTKLRGVNTNNANATKKAMKATAYLVPMFGLQFLFTLVSPKRTLTSCSGMEVYMFFALAVNGLQGVYVSIIYCYINKEVQLNVRRSLVNRFPQLVTYLYTQDSVNTVTTYSYVQSEGGGNTTTFDYEDDDSEIKDTPL